MIKRRTFLYQSSQALIGVGLVGLGACQTGSKGESQAKPEEPTSEETGQEEQRYANGLWFGISLAQWSLNKSLKDGTLDNLDFAAKAKNEFDIDAIEYVNQFFEDKALDAKYLAEMNKRAADHGVHQLLIMIDNEGDLGSTETKMRNKAVDNHKKWVDAALTLGCHSIRVNAAGEGTAEEVGQSAIDGLRSLSEFAKEAGINVIVENHGGYSSDGNWLSNVIKNVGLENCGTLPDFGNFCVEKKDGDCVNMYDRYKGVEELMPYAKAVSAKSHDFDAEGNEIHTDYEKILGIVKEAGYRGYIGIEYEGDELSAEEGIKATKALLEQVGK